MAEWPEVGQLFSLLLALLAAYLVMQLIVFTLRRRQQHKTFERMQVPGPKPHLIHGHLYETRREAYVRFAHKMHERYGPTVGMYLGGDPYLMTKDLELIQQVFVAKSRIFYDRMNFYMNVDPVPDNLICQRGDRWRYMRKLLTPAFTHSKISKSSQFYRDAQQTVDKFMRQLEAQAQQVQVPDSSTGELRRETLVEDAYDRMAAVALDVIVKTAFHMDNVISFCGPVNSFSKGKQGKSNTGGYFAAKSTTDADLFLNTVKRACRLAFNPLVELIFCFPMLDAPLTFLCNRLYFGSIIQLLFDRLDYLVRRSDYRSSPEPVSGQASQTQTKQVKPQRVGSPPKEQPQHRRRIIDSLVQVLRERRITKSEFTGNAFVIVFAGFETTANALTFTLWLLAKNQRVQRKLRDELRSQMAKLREKQSASPETVAGDERDADRELAELAFGCSYLEMVINESLRLYPPVPGLSCRQASVECRLANGLLIEQGVNVIPSVYSIHRDKGIWGESANEFVPERFEVLDTTQLNSAMFMPFGLGPRNCIGKAAAMHEMKIVIGRLISEYSIECWPGKTPERLRLCSPINITITNADKIGLRFLKLTR